MYAIIISIGNSELFNKVAMLVKNQLIMQFVIPITGKYLTNNIDLRFSIATFNSELINANIKIINNINFNEILILFPNETDEDFINEFVRKASSMTYHVLPINYSNFTNHELNIFFSEKVKRKKRILYLFENKMENIFRILKLAKSQNILHQNYFWIIVSSNMIDEGKLLKLLDFHNIPNIALTVLKLMENCTNSCNIVFFKVKKVIDLLSQLMVSDFSIFQKLNCSNNDINQKFLLGQQIMKSQIFSNFNRSMNQFLIRTTKSIDITFSTPNVFTFETKFENSAFWDSDTNSYIQLHNGNLFYNKFSGFNNKTIYICSPSSTPGNVVLVNSSTFSVNQSSGLVPMILKGLEQFMHFKAILYEASDKQFGTRIENSSKFTGCIGEIQDNKAIFAAGMYTLTSQRNEFVDFSNPYMEESNVPLLRKPRPSSKIWHVLRPLQYSVWIFILISVIFVSICCFIFSKHSPLSAWNLNINFAIIDEIKLKENTWNVIGSLFMQGQDFYPFCISSRIVLAVWWIYAVIILSAYSADLTSFLTVQEKGDFISNLNELANRKDLYIMVPKGTNIDSSLAESQNDVYRELNRRKIVIDNVDDCPNKILDPSSTNLVCISDRSEIFNIAALGFILPKDSPHKQMMDSYIQILVENGIITKWVRKYWGDDEITSRNCDGDNGNSADAINFEGITGICILTCSLFVIGLFFFSIELIWVKVCKKSVNNFPF